MKKTISSIRQGFTLIELLVVMAILGLLATIGLVSFRTAQMKGRDAQRKHDLGQIQKALEMHYNDKGRYRNYPTERLPSGGSEWEDTTVTDGALYMKSVPSDPKGGNYCYESDANGTYYKLYAKLENNRDPKIIVPNSSVCASYNYGVSSSNISP